MSLKGATRPYILIDMDCSQLLLNDGDSKNDYVFIGDDNSWVVPMEMTKGSLRVSEVLKQLQAGSRYVEKVIPKRTRVNFLPVAVVGGKISRKEHNELRQKRSHVGFRGVKVRIQVLKCKDPLVKALRAKTA